MRAIASILGAGLVLAACTTAPKVNTDYDPSVNFSGYRSYTWAYSEAQRGANPLTYQRVKAAIDQNLSARGYTLSSTPDFAIGFTLGARDRVEVNDMGAYGPYYPGYGVGYRGGWARPYSPVEVRNVTDGTITVDVYDAGTKKAVWNGRAQKEIPSSGPDPALIQQVVDAVMAKFPPGATAP